MVASMATPIIYACSGGCNLGQMANYVALCLDRARVGKMSSVAGVGGDVAGFLAIAKSRRQIVAIDGCQKQCAKRCLERHGVDMRHYVLTDFGLTKQSCLDFDESEAAFVFEHIRTALAKPAGTIVSPTRSSAADSIRR